MVDHTPTDPPPLWRAMRRAESSYCQDLTSSDARMIRAIANEMVMHFDPWLAEHAAVAQWLHSEADRAERGENAK